MAEIVAQDPDLARRFRILTSIPGIAQASAFTILIALPELGSLDAKPLAALVGQAPFVRQSGRWNGRAKIKGGRHYVRQALYWLAIVASRFNPDLKAKYRQLTAAGKPSKLAIIAVMRKLLILANALLR